MAEQTKDKAEKLVSTELYSKAFFNSNDKSKSKRLVINLLNNSTQIAIIQADAEGKFSSGTRVAATINQFNFIMLYNACKELITRLEDIIEKGKEVKKDSILIANGRDIKSATQKIEMNISSPEGNNEFKSKFSGYIKVTRKDVDGKEESAIIWLSTSRTVYRGNEDKPAADYQAYQVLQEIMMSAEACVARTSLSRDEHMRKYLKNLYGSNENNKDQYKGKTESGSENEDFPY